ncbi:hypothetical protein [Paenibacillus sp. NFR01]|uniref:hypothetical protein n=1 Tax=Paenibacillus sp. NFR01 TaxID=1566279 RepID=UPI0008CFB8F3|nr:hypothetical protein [Paenibacillus sp. NFR01]SET06408.1 hypothetical protein SAMN03159358_0642 [Paenibacillus sp. NFR01]
MHRRNSNSNVQDELSFAERTGRLVLVTTVIGVLAIGYYKLLKIAIDLLFSKIYLKFPFSTEHLIVTCMLTTGLLILIRTIYYCFCEFSALDYSNKGTKRKENIKRADDSYSMLFKFSYLYVGLSIFISALFTIATAIYFQNIIIISFFIVLLSPFLLGLFSRNFRQQIHKGLLIIKKNLKEIWAWGGISIIILMLLVVTMGGMQKLSFQVNFINDKKLPIKIHFENKIPDNVTLSFISTNDNEENDILTKEIKLTEKDFNRSFIEATEKSIKETKTHSIINYLNKEMKKGFQEAYLSKISHYDYNYALNASSYLKPGKNYVVIQFQIESLNNRFYKIVNEIDVSEAGAFLINKEDFVYK